MSAQGYQVAYRRHRPKRFQDVLGQSHVTGPLRQSVKNGEMAHAYIFSGYHGCGKTTSARILAAAINCTNRGPDEDWDGEPCGVCDICDTILSGTGWNIGVKEHNCGESNGVDAVRDLLASSGLGSIARYRVFILDEAHNLTTNAQTALLKDIEEPSDNTKYILATTNPDKLLGTIRSRAAKFNFPQVKSDVLEDLVSGVIEKDGLDLTSEQRNSIIVEGNGSPRDTLSALEKIATGGNIETTNYTDLIVQGLIENDISSVFISIANAIEEGYTPVDLSNSLISYLRDCIFMLQAPDLVQAPAEVKERTLEHASAFKTAKIIQMMEIITDTIGGSRGNVDPRVLLERALVQVLMPETQKIIGRQLMEAMDELREQITEISLRIDKIATQPVIQSPPVGARTGTGDDVWGSNWGETDQKPRLVSVSPETESEKKTTDEHEEVEAPRKRRRSTAENPSSSNTSSVPITESPAEILANIKTTIGRRLMFKLTNAVVQIEGRDAEGNIEVIIGTEKDLEEKHKTSIENRLQNSDEISYRIVGWK